jgi:glucoamylase
MPLVWAHAEHVKLLRSLADGDVFDMPPQPRRRYQIDNVGTRFCAWRSNNKCRGMAAGLIVRIELPAVAVVHWSADDWQTVRDTPTRDSGFGVHVADLDTVGIPAGGSVVFTMRWAADSRWEGRDYQIAIT